VGFGFPGSQGSYRFGEKQLERKEGKEGNEGKEGEREKLI